MSGRVVRLPRQIPWPFAMKILLTGDLFTAQQAPEEGLVNRVVDGAHVLDEAMAMAQRLCRDGPLAPRTVKESAVRGLNLEQASLRTAISPAGGSARRTSREGPAAFMEKRVPRFTGR